MSKIIILLLLAFTPLLWSCSSSVTEKAAELNGSDVDASALIGAWEFTADTSSVVRIFQDRYFTVSHFNVDAKSFYETYGGIWFFDDGKYHEVIEFHSRDSLKVGDTLVVDLDMMANGNLVIGDLEYSNIDKNEPGSLEGAWLFAGRMKENVIERRTPGPRKTLKILSGTRFQWVAFHVDEKQFLGTGGGTYVSESGAYVETIEFFSRDSQRVGAVLPFKYELIDSEWHHSGKNSSGDDLYEVWAPRRTFESTVAPE